MALLLFVAGTGIAVAVSLGCGANTASQERQPDTPIRAKAITRAASAISVPQSPTDMGIRRDLNVAIARDSDLRNRRINFIVANGDVSVTGTVRTENERRKINDLAMNIGGVKSVANALLIAE